MKALILTVIFFAACFSLTAQEEELTGSWKIIEFSVSNNGESDLKDESMLNEEGLVWNIVLKSGNEFTQTSNMRNGTMETQEGEWKATDDKLTLEFEIDGDDFKITYEYMFEDDVLMLTRSSPDAKVSVQAKFTKQ